MKPRLSLVSMITVCWFALGPAYGGTIVLSGDGNIQDPLLSPGNDNDTFFLNVLGTGTSVQVLANSLIPSWDSRVNSFYGSQPGVTSSIVSGAVTTSSLTGVDLFVSMLPDDAFSAGEVSAMSSFLSGGGTIFFLGENQALLFATANASINGALAGLGSSMSLVPPGVLDGGLHTAGPGQVLPNPLTTGVVTFTYAAPSEIVGGQALFLMSDLSTVFVAVESNTVPEPGTLALVGAGLLGLVALRRQAV